MSAWFALTQGRLSDAIESAQAGRAIAPQSSVEVQLIAQEAKARARLGESDLQPLLDSGREILDRLPYPGRPDNHFEVDPAKWEYYAMDVHRLAGNDQLARQYATAVIQDNLASQASTAPASRPSLVMVAGELSSELTTRYPNEPLTHHFTEAAPTL